MGLTDIISPEDRVQVKFSDFYKLIKGCTERDLMVNAVECKVPCKHIKSMLNGKTEGEND